MKVFQVLLTGLALAAGAALAVAQTQDAPPPPPQHAPMFEVGPRPGGPEIEFLRTEMMEMHQQVKGAPYTATVVTESTQVLADGNRIVNKHSGLVARDSEGRMRREETMGRIGPLQVNVPKVVFINDPVAHASFVLNPDKKVAWNMQHEGMRRNMRELHQQIGSLHGDAEAQRPGMGQLKKESLGTQQIEGVTAEGTRITRTIPAGTIGNEKPINITVETWISPGLHVLVLSKRSDPRFGETVYRLTNIQRAEPDASLFQVPSDFKMEQGPPAHMRMMRRPAPPPAAAQKT